jgi:uncharacterized membrane protein
MLTNMEKALVRAGKVIGIIVAVFGVITFISELFDLGWSLKSIATWVSALTIVTVVSGFFASLVPEAFVDTKHDGVMALCLTVAAFVTLFAIGVIFLLTTPILSDVTSNPVGATLCVAGGVAIVGLGALVSTLDSKKTDENS